MDPAVLVTLALIFGITMGASLVSLTHFAARRGERAVRVVSGAVPDGIDQVIDALDSAGIVVDPSNNVIKSSPAAAALGLVSGDALIHPEMVALVDRVRRSGELVSDELALSRGPFGDVSVFLHVQGTRLGSRFILVLAQDRTESHRLEEVRRDFIANISHELKTPIGAVSLLAEALQAASDDPVQVRRFAKRLTKESDRLARITREIIELSRLQAADALAQPELVSVDEVVTQAIDQDRVQADAANVTIASRGDSDARVYGDESLLVVALHNLISNAVQYSPTGSRVGIGVSHADGIVEIAVTDQGVGISEDDLSRVFERFYRIDDARSRHTGGTGLGLSIVKHVVQKHGGDIRVWSQPGRGSTFTIRLPEAAPASAVSPKEIE